MSLHQKSCIRRGVMGALVIAMVSVGITACGQSDQSRAVGSIGGSEISAAEFAVHLRETRPRVENQVRNDLGIAPEESLDWGLTVGDGTAAELLEAEAFEAAVEAKVMQIKALEAGVIATIDYGDWIVARQEMNENNSQAQDANQVVYGLVKYGEDEFYRKTMANLRADLARELGQDEHSPLYVGEAEAREAYDADPDRWRANATLLRVEVLRVNAEGQDQNAAWKNAEAVASQGDAAWENLTSIEGSVVSEIQVNAAGEVFVGDAQPTGAVPRSVAEALLNAAPGELVGPTTLDGKVSVFRLLDAETSAEKAFLEYSGRIRASLLDERLTDYLQDARASLPIERHEEVALSLVKEATK